MELINSTSNGAHRDVSEVVNDEFEFSPCRTVNDKIKLSVIEVSNPNAVAKTSTLIFTEHAPATKAVPHIVTHPRFFAIRRVINPI